MSEKIWHRRKRERPQEIRAAALVEFSLKGFDAVTMAAIAARAGITKGTIYLYYRNKQDLFETLLEELGCIVGSFGCVACTKSSGYPCRQDGRNFSVEDDCQPSQTKFAQTHTG